MRLASATAASARGEADAATRMAAAEERLATRLNAGAEPVPFDSIKASVEKSLEQPISEAYAWFDPQPLGTASLGQAHAARLHDGTEVVVKVLHAGVERLLTLPPGAFRPAQKVHSAVVRLVFRPPAVPLPDEAVFTAMVRAIFTQRRKMQGNALEPFAAARGRSAAAPCGHCRSPRASWAC